ncbi:MAG: hypothetical protein IJ487_02630 [Ruminococcus sp.]|nr:hypothetical protein [Ruminococcus sp.]
MKKLTSLTAAILISSLSTSINASADDSTKVLVTISDAQGNLALTQQEIEVSDTDADGKLTISDALYLAHDAHYEGGAAAGYRAEQTAYGLSLSKLWGSENGGSYGYYLNDAFALSLVDEISSGDRINAYVFTDLETYSDTYCFFNGSTADITQGDELSLTLSAIAFDENYAPVNVPCVGAEIIINGKNSGVFTDNNGKAAFTVSDSGRVIISASSDKQTLVPPVCIVNSEANPAITTTAAASTTTPITTTVSAAAQTGSSSPNTGDSGIAAIALLMGVSVALAIKSRHEN